MVFLLQHWSNNLIKQTQTFPLVNPYAKFSIQRGPRALDESSLPPAWMSRWGGRVEGQNWPYFTEIPSIPPQLTCSGIFPMRRVAVADRRAKFKVPSWIWPTTSFHIFFQLGAPAECKQEGETISHLQYHLTTLNKSCILNMWRYHHMHSPVTSFLLSILWLYEKVAAPRAKVWFVYEIPVWKVKQAANWIVILSVYAKFSHDEYLDSSLFSYTPGVQK